MQTPVAALWLSSCERPFSVTGSQHIQQHYILAGLAVFPLSPTSSQVFFSTVTSLELSLQCIKKEHFAGKGLKLFGVLSNLPTFRMIIWV